MSSEFSRDEIMRMYGALGYKVYFLVLEEDQPKYLSLLSNTSIYLCLIVVAMFKLFHI